MGVQETITPTTHPLVQDDEMDKRVAYQNFGFFVPMPTTEDDPDVPYNTMAEWASWFSDVGITDIWMAPPYKTLATNPYHEGYAACDRYDVGEFPNGANMLIRTKYGNKEQLINCISTLKQYGVNCLADIVPNQQYMPSPRIVIVSASNQDGSIIDDPNYQNFPYYCYPAGAPAGQVKYGLMKSWEPQHFNGTDPQSMGRYRVMTDANGTPFTVPFPFMTVYLKSWDDAPYFGWSPSTASQVDNMDSTKTATQANFVIESENPTETYTYTSITVKCVDGVTRTAGYNLLPGANVPVWFITECLAYMLAGWGFTIQTHEDAGYISVADGFVQFVTFTPYALFYESPVPKYINQTFVDYCLNLIDDSSYSGLDGVLKWNSAQGGNSPIGKWMTNWSGAQPAYNAATEVTSKGGITAFQFIKDGTGIGSNTYDVDRNIIQYEFLIGTDVDNTRPDVQAEYIHWADWLLELGFDGFRIDAADHCNWDLHFLLNNHMYEKYGDDYNRHIVLMECYVTDAYTFLKNGNYPAFAMDAPFWGSCQSELAWPFGTNHNLANIFTQSVGWPARVTAGAAVQPNCSFCMNHDQEKNQATMYTPRAPFPNDGSVASQYDQFDQFDYDRKLTNKKNAYRNVPSMYAVMLTNRGTVPIVYYGDLFNGDKVYMAEKTPYFNIIQALLKIRKRYVSGEQTVQFHVSNTSTQAGKDLCSSVRVGTTRDTGCAVIVGNNPDTFTKISVPMGQNHANQVFRNIIAIGDEYQQTDANGNLSVWVSGEQSVFIYGHLSVWIPVA